MNPNRSKYYCTHCKVTGHSLERCFKANPNRPVCSPCHMPSHSNEACCKLHAYPKGHKLYNKQSSGPYANQVISTSICEQEQSMNTRQSTITQEQYTQLMNLLQQNQPSVYSVHSTRTTPNDNQMPRFSGMTLCLYVYSNKPKNALNTPWIIDTGASDHISCDKSLYDTMTAKFLTQ